MSFKRNILTEDLKPGMIIAEPVYVLSSAGVSLLAVRQGSEVTDRIINLLNRHRIKWVEIIIKTQNKNTETLKTNLTPRIRFNANEEPPEVKSIIGEQLRKEAVDNISNLFSFLGNSNESTNMTTAFQAVNGFESALNGVLNAVTSSTSGLVHIHDLKSYDEYTYHHSLSTTLLSIATGQALGLEQKTLLALGRCAMLHDIGKQSIPIEIINKQGKLTNDEFEIIKMHPVFGMQTLKNKKMGNQELWNAVLFHHEKINGKGYPNKLEKDEIPLFSKIIAVADIYDAVTSYRSYRTPMTPADAHELVCSETGSALDYDIVMAFTKKLSLYPIGTFLELSNRRVGVVTDDSSILRPIVKMIDNSEMIDLNSIKHLTLTIAKVVNPDEILIQY